MTNKTILLNKQILQWHTNTFKNITEQEQLNKVQEELKELQEEVADVFISTIAGMERFKDNKTFKYIYKTLIDNNLFDIQAIQNKLNINKKRKWKKINSIYRHY